MDLNKMFENYVSAKSTLGGCVLKIVSALVILLAEYIAAGNLS